jgi:hypothetical protein
MRNTLPLGSPAADRGLPSVVLGGTMNNAVHVPVPGLLSTFHHIGRSMLGYAFHCLLVVSSRSLAGTPQCALCPAPFSRQLHAIGASHKVSATSYLFLHFAYSSSYSVPGPPHRFQRCVMIWPIRTCEVVPVRICLAPISGAFLAIPHLRCPRACAPFASIGWPTDGHVHILSSSDASCTLLFPFIP